MAHVLRTSVTFAVQKHLLMRVPGFALHIPVIWSSIGPILSDMVLLGVSASLLRLSGTNFRHNTFELRALVVNYLHEG